MWAYWVFWCLAWLVRPFPLKLGYKMADGFGRWIFGRLGRHKKIALFNLKLAFPEASQEEIEEMGRAAMGSSLMILFELLKFFHASNKSVLGMVDLLGASHFLENPGKAGIGASAHTGSWELLPALVTNYGVKLAAVASRIRHPGANRIFEASRQRKGIEVIYRDPGVMSTLRQALKEGKVATLVADQHSGDRGIMVTFFENPAWAFKGPAQLAIETGLPITPSFCYRGKDHRAVMTAGIPIYPPGPEVEDPLFYMTQLFHIQLQDFIRSHPESYFWVHRKFKGTVVGG